MYQFMNNIRSGKIFPGLKGALKRTIMHARREDVEGIGESGKHEIFCGGMKCEECPFCSRYGCCDPELTLDEWVDVSIAYMDNTYIAPWEVCEE